MLTRSWRSATRTSSTTRPVRGESTYNAPITRPPSTSGTINRLPVSCDLRSFRSSGISSRLRARSGAFAGVAGAEAAVQLAARGRDERQYRAIEAAECHRLAQHPEHDGVQLDLRRIHWLLLFVRGTWRPVGCGRSHGRR